VGHFGFFLNAGKYLQHSLIKQKRVFSLLMKNRAKIYYKITEWRTQEIPPTPRLRGPRRDSHKCKISNPNSEQMTQTLPNIIVELTNTIEAVWSHIKIHAKTQTPATRQRRSNSENKLLRKTRQSCRKAGLVEGHGEIPSASFNSQKNFDFHCATERWFGIGVHCPYSFVN
jgi:hypothetical protein